MPRVRRKSKKNKAGYLSFHQILVLTCGFRDPLKYPLIPRDQLGYLSLKEVKEAWKLHKHNPRVARWYDPDQEDYQPGRRPWAWWQFESKKPRDRRMRQQDQLAAMGVLLPHEKLDLERRQAKRLNEDFKLPEIPEGGFLPIPDLEPYPPEIQDLVDEVTPTVEREPWFEWICDAGTGQLNAQDANAIKNFGATVDLERGWHVVDFIETFCKQSQGSEWDGEYLELLDYQVREFLLPVFSWVMPNGLRRFKEAYLWIAKKNGKSTLCGALNTYGALGDGEGGPKVFNAAVTRDQCTEVYGVATAMVDASPDIRTQLKPKDSVKEIHFRSGSAAGRGRRTEQFVIKALAAEAASSEGKNASMIIFDELHVWKDGNFYSSLRFAGAARRQPLSIHISTAGDSVEGLGGQKYQMCCEMRDGQRLNYSVFSKIYESPPGMDYNDPRVYLNPEIWKLANPAIGITIAYWGLYESILTSLGSPSDWADILRYRLNQWVDGAQPYLNMSDWYACGKKLFKLEDLRGVTPIGALDLAAVEDLVSLLWCWFYEGRYHFLWRFWTPEAKVQEMLDDNDDRYSKWVAEGHIIQCPGARIDQTMIFDQLGLDCRAFGQKEIVFDKWNAEWLMGEVSKKGIRVVEFSQGNNSWDFVLRNLTGLLKDQAILHNANPVAQWQARNLTVKKSPQDKHYPIKRDKDKRFKIDGMIAMLMALDRQLRHTKKYASSMIDPTQRTGLKELITGKKNH